MSLTHGERTYRITKPMTPIYGTGMHLTMTAMAIVTAASETAICGMTNREENMRSDCSWSTSNDFYKIVFAFRKFFCLLVILGLHAPVFAQFSVNGVEPCYDSITGTFLLSVDRQLWGKSWTTEVRINDGSSWKDMMIDGERADGQYTFPEIGGDSHYTLEITENGDRKFYNLHFTYLPVLKFVEGSIGMDYTDDVCIIQYKSESQHSLRARVKWRGGTTNMDGRNKRNYKMKLIDDRGGKNDMSFFGLRKDNSWILDAGQIDMFRMRNLIASQIWQDFASKPYYAAEEPKALSATRGQMVELFLGNQYQGVFNFCEPIDRKQMKLRKYDSDGTIHGGLWKATGHGDCTFWNIPEEYDNTKDRNNEWELKYPEIDDLCPSDYSTLRNAIMFVVTSTDTDFNHEVSAYFDIPVLIDYYLFVQITNGFDNCGKNVYWAVYDKQAEKKLTPAMWDMDCTMGQNFIDSPLHPEYVAYNNPILTPNNIFHRMIQLDTDQFQDAVRHRYSQLRDNVFSTESLQARYIEAYNTLYDCGAATREEQRWSYDTDISGLKLDLKEELDYICDWISNRMQFLDEQFSFTPNSIRETGHRTMPEKNVHTLQGHRAYPQYKGLVISGGRIMLKK